MQATNKHLLVSGQAKNKRSASVVLPNNKHKDNRTSKSLATKAVSVTKTTPNAADTQNNIFNLTTPSQLLLTSGKTSSKRLKTHRVIFNHRFGFIRSQSAKPFQTNTWRSLKRPRYIYGALALLILASAVITNYLTFHQVRATATLTWTNNADFSMNKIGKCGATTLNGVTVTGTAYTDPTCAAAGGDTDIRLAAGQVPLNNVIQIVAGGSHSLALRSDGTVWAWGGNYGGQLGDNTYVNRTFPIQVKDPAGTGYLTGITAIAAGLKHSLALKNDGTVWAWGYNGHYELGDGTGADRLLPVQVGGGLSNITAISAGYYHSVARKNDGTVWGWGYNAHGELGDNSTSNRSTPIQVKDPTGASYLTSVTSIKAGIYHTLALKSDGNVYGWGYNNFGVVGDGTSGNNKLLPVQTKDAPGTGYLSNITAIAGGNNISLAVKNDGTVWAWGDNGEGQLGDATNTTPRSLPIQVKDTSGTGYLTGVSAVSAGYSYSVALKNDGTVWTWGKNEYGQLGDNSPASHFTPVQVKDTSGAGYLAGVTAISAGFYHALAISSSGTIWAWGNNQYGQDGYSATSTFYTNVNIQRIPILVLARINTANISNITAIDTNIAIKNDGTVWGWGTNGNGQLGDGTVNSRPTAAAVNNGYLSGITAIAAGGMHTLALKSDGTVWAWGGGGSGVLGDSGASGLDRYLPVQVAGPGGSGFLTNIIAIAAGQNHSLALKNDGTVWAWGANTYGQLGKGDTSLSYYAVQVKDAPGTGYLTGITSIAAGGSHNFAIKDDGSIWAWGYNGYGQLGDNTITQRNLPVQVKDAPGTGYLSGITSIKAGGGHSSIALKNDGTVWAWGNNGNGQLGDNSTTQRNLPIQVKDTPGTGYLSSITAVDNGYGANSMALKNDGTVFAWGYGYYGNLGRNTTGGSSLPLQVLDPSGSGNLSNISAIAVGANYMTALKTDGTVLSWGYNYGSQLGIGTQIQGVLPANVITSVDLNAGYAGTGMGLGFIADMGSNRKTKWYTLDWTTSALPANTSLKFNVRSSDDAVTWSSWSADHTQSTPGSTTGTADISAFPFTRYLEVKATFTSTDLVSTPTLLDFSIVHMDDQNPPTWVYPAAIPVYTDDGKGTALTSNTWTANNNLDSIYADWSGATEPGGESGIAHYYVYIGTDNTANPITAGVDMGTATEGYIDLPDNPPGGTYYLRVTVSDLAGNNLNMPSGNDVFKYLFDNTKPTNPSYVSVSPVGWSITNSFDFSWPDALDPGSGSSNIAYYQYKKAAGGDTWHDTVDKSVTAITSYQDGRNEFFVRAVDNAGNTADSQTSVYYYYNGSAPSKPTSLTVVPPNALSNSFTFTWAEPDTHNADIRGYYYSINAEPTINNSVFTTNTTTGAIPAATQQGFNTFYVVAVDADDQINWASFEEITFECNTTAPGIPGGVVISDSSNRAADDWALTVKWQAPGTGVVDHYAVYRSTNGINFAQIAETSSAGYLDSGLSNTSVYFYKITAVDNAAAESGFSSTVTKQPTGKFTEPPLIVTGPIVDVKATRATVTWSTDRVSSSFVAYSKDNSYAESKGQVDSVTSHSVELSGLEAGTTYNFKVQSLDENRDYPIESAYSGEFNFTTQSAPAISEVNVSDIRLNSAVVTWKTTTVATSTIVYGKTTNYGQTIQDQSGSVVTTHTVKIDGLDHSTPYFFKIYGIDSDGNQLVSDNYAFATLTYPRVYDVHFEQQKNTATSTLLVTWTTNVPTSSTVSYHQEAETSREVAESALKTTHSMLVPNLQDNVLYYMSVGGRDAYGNSAISDTQRVQTDYDTRPPAISDITTESSSSGYGLDTKAQIIISWITDEPSTSQVEFAEGVTGDSYNMRSPQDTSLTTSHVVVLTDLKPSSSYYFRVLSADASRNQAVSASDSVLTDLAKASILDIIIKSLQDTLGWLFGQ